MANRVTLTKVEAGVYRCGPYRIEGRMMRHDGRDGSRINKWLVFTNCELPDRGQWTLVTQAPTLDLVRVLLEPKLAKGTV